MRSSSPNSLDNRLQLDSGLRATTMVYIELVHHSYQRARAGRNKQIFHTHEDVSVASYVAVRRNHLMTAHHDIELCTEVWHGRIDVKCALEMGREFACETIIKVDTSIVCSGSSRVGLPFRSELLIGCLFSRGSRTFSSALLGHSYSTKACP